MEGFKQLTTWQKAYNLGLEIYKLAAIFPRRELFGLSSQIQRAGVSISANIAEGYGRNYRKEYLQFLMIAKGSLGEVETYLLFSKDLKYISLEQYNQIEGLRQEVGKLLKGLIKSLQA